MVEQAGLTEAIVHVRRTIAATTGEWTAVQEAVDGLTPQLAQVAEKLARAELSAEVVAALQEIAAQSGQWAIRSSVTIEDDPYHSFAGQFLSLLSVPSGERLVEATRRVWASAFKPKPLAYCAQKRIAMPHVAVIYQPMTPITASDRSGMAFSHSPVAAMPGVLIQATFGAIKPIVDGYGGDLYSVQGEDVRTQITPTAQIHVSAAGGGLLPQPAPMDSPLTEDEARYLAALIGRVARRWGKPVNVEFVWQSGQGPLIVQIRSALHPLVAQLIHPDTR
jgi:pyruvate,water dikinase